MFPTLIPHGRTTRRVEWTHLPARVRARVEEQCGSPVVTATSQGSGFTPGFASVLTCEDGSRHFVKSASEQAQKMFADAYRDEARKLALLPETAPAARLRWTVEEEGWFALGIEHVESRQPHRPWRPADLAAALDALEIVADTLTPPPDGVTEVSFGQDFAEFPSYWEHLRSARPVLPHLEEAAGLAARFEEVCEGDTLVHTDVRDDNVLIRPDGTALYCDWNFPCRGAAWLDSVFMLIGPRGDGLDVEAVLSERRLTRGVPADHVDVVLALLVGYFLRQSDLPVPPTSPHLRDAQWWQGIVVWDWLCERRGWPRPEGDAVSLRDLGRRARRC